MATPIVTVTKFPDGIRAWHVKAGTTLSGYDPNRPNQAFSTTKFLKDSSGHADAQVKVSWNVSPEPIPRGGPFLRVTDGIYKGLLIVQALVTVDGITPPPPPPTTGLPHSLNPLVYPARFQFGEVGAPCGGSSCCTDTCIKMLVEYWKERTYSLAAIRKAAQAKSSYNEAPCTGINPQETLNALTTYGVNNYQPAFGINASFVASKLVNGPVLVGVGYGKYPRAANGRCGATNLAELGGATDCGFIATRGAHAVVALATSTHAAKHTGLDVLVRDPDHNSAARPEKPAYDRYRLTQLQAAMTALVTDTPWTKTYCLYPTSKKVL